MDEKKQDDVQSENQTDIQSESDTQPQIESEITNQEKSMGPVLGSIIIVIILIVAAFYVWGRGADQNNVNNTAETGVQDNSFDVNSGNADIVRDETIPLDVSTETVVDTVDTATESLNTQSASDEIVAIETDLETTDFTGLDAELADIEMELQ